MKTKKVIFSFIVLSSFTAFLCAEEIDGTVTKTLHMDVPASTTSTYEITDGSTLTFQNITNSINDGGAVTVNSGATFIVAPDHSGGSGQVIFQNNTAAGRNGGGIGNTGGNLSVENALFDNNKATGGSGGGVSNYQGTININNATFSGNQATIGGAITNSVNVSVPSSAVITDSSFFGNSSSFGGAIYNNESSLSVFAVNKDVEFSGNKANGVSNAVLSAWGTLYFAADSGRQVLFRDAVTTFSGFEDTFI